MRLAGIAIVTLLVTAVAAVRSPNEAGLEIATEAGAVGRDEAANILGEAFSGSAATGTDVGEAATVDSGIQISDEAVQISRNVGLPVIPTVGASYGQTVPGVLTFRGSASRTFYGTGPMPTEPRILWRFPRDGGMCSNSRGGVQLGQDHFKCGTGWTGQPVVFERQGRTWVIFGAYDRKVHFLDAATGEPILPSLETGDHIKGSGTVDPDGFPIFYIGSRDNKLRAIALDREIPTVLWELDADDGDPGLWNDDWDGAPLVLDDHLIVGGENSRFQVARLNRSYDADGLVTMAPELVIDVPGWDDQLLSDIGDETVSIENSVTVVGNVAYFANSGGLLQGWTLDGLADGKPTERVFRFWLGDDADSTIVADDEGFLYAATEYERGLRRSREIGQIVKIDPSKPDDPVVWSVADHDKLAGGVWATPAIHGDLLYVGTDGGRLLAIDRNDGSIRWSMQLNKLWSSPVVVDDVLLQGDCSGAFRAFDVSDRTSRPPELWSIDLKGCIESTPSVWNGRIYVGSRDGQMFAIGD